MYSKFVIEVKYPWAKARAVADKLQGQAEYTTVVQYPINVKGKTKVRPKVRVRFMTQEENMFETFIYMLVELYRAEFQNE